MKRATIQRVSGLGRQDRRVSYRVTDNGGVVCGGGPVSLFVAVENCRALKAALPANVEELLIADLVSRGGEVPAKQDYHVGNDYLNELLDMLALVEEVS